MTIGLYILLYIALMGVNIGIAAINVGVVADRIKVGDTRQINHFIWGLIYLAPCAPLYFINHWLFYSVIPLHLSIFPVSYNLFRELPPFNLSKTSKALTDRFMVKIGLKSTETVNLAAQLLSFFLLYKAIR